MPTYLVVAQSMAARIAEGEWGPGKRLPSTEDLATQYRVGQSTILHAMRYLLALGVIRSVQGGGRYVAGDPNDLEPTQEMGTDD